MKKHVKLGVMNNICPVLTVCCPYGENDQNDLGYLLKCFSLFLLFPLKIIATFLFLGQLGFLIVSLHQKTITIIKI